VREKDETNSKAKAKKEFPEAPVTIGMEDERGGKGMAWSINTPMTLALAGDNCPCGTMGAHDL
jgi:hypothetical protein